MKEGIVALILQWSLFCLVWMGALDRVLAQVTLSRRMTLAGLAVFLVFTFADWRLPLMPLAFTLSGAVMPLVLAGVIWPRGGHSSHTYVLAAAGLAMAIVFFLRKLLFWDPVLMIVDERLLVPLLLVTTVLLLTRRLHEQLLILLLALPLADALYILSFSSYGAALVIGGAAAQDLLWAAVALWGCANAAWLASRSAFSLFFARLPLRFRWRMRPPSQR